MLHHLWEIECTVMRLYAALPLQFKFEWRCIRIANEWKSKFRNNLHVYLIRLNTIIHYMDKNRMDDAKTDIFCHNIEAQQGAFYSKNGAQFHSLKCSTIWCYLYIEQKWTVEKSKQLFVVVKTIVYLCVYTVHFKYIIISFVCKYNFCLLADFVFDLSFAVLWQK